MKKRKVLILEDQEENYQVIKSVILKFPEIELIDLGVCSSFEQAQEMLQLSPDLIFLDHNLSQEGKEGLLLAQYVRQNMKASVQIVSTTDDKGHQISHVQKLYQGLNVPFYTSKDPKKVKKTIFRMIAFWGKDVQEKTDLAFPAICLTNFPLGWNDALNRHYCYVEKKDLIFQDLNFEKLDQARAIFFYFGPQKMKEWQRFEAGDYDFCLERLYQENLLTSTKVLISLFEFNLKEIFSGLEPWIDFIWTLDGGPVQDFSSLIL